MVIERLLLLPAMSLLVGSAGLLAPDATAERHAAVIDRSQAPTVPTNRDLVRINRSPDGLYRLPGQVGGTHFELVVDTGASRTMLNRATLDAIASQGGSVTLLDEPPLLYETVAGRAMLQRATVMDLQVAGRAIAAIEVAVLDTGTAPNILGTDLLGTLGPLQVSEQTLELGVI